MDTKHSWKNCRDSLQTAPLRKQYTSNDYLLLQDTGVSTSCFILTLKICVCIFLVLVACDWCTKMLWLFRGVRRSSYFMDKPCEHMIYSKLYGWHIIHLHACSQSGICNANPENNLKENKVRHCLLFISVTKKCPTVLYPYSLYLCYRIMTFIYSQRMSCLTEVLDRGKGKWCLKPSHDNAMQQAKMKKKHFTVYDKDFLREDKSSIIRLSLKVFR